MSQLQEEVTGAASDRPFNLDEQGGSKGHPKGLYLLFTTEMWERFSYYGMRAILVLYMTKVLGFMDSRATEIYGNFTGLVYLTPLIGGYISDRYWGNRKSIIVGGFIIALGQFVLFFSASFVHSLPQMAPILLILGLFLLISGNGLFKPNISTMVNQLYAPGDKRIDSAFTIFYMGINLGALFSPIICGTLAEKVDFRWGFFAAGIGMVAGLIVFILLKNKYVVRADGQPVGMKPEKITPTVTEGTEGVAAPKGNTMGRGILWLVIFAVLFFLFYQFVFEQNYISAFIFSCSIASGGFIITDPTLTTVERKRIWVLYIVAFFVIFFWSAFEQAGASLTIFAEQSTDRVIFGWEMPASWFQSVNPVAIIIFAPLFAMLWTGLGKRNKEPSSPMKQAIGLFLLSIGYFVIAFGVKGVDASIKVSMIWLISMYMIHTWGELCLSPIGLSMVARLAPVRLASLLMGVWFMANAMANDMSGQLGKLYPESVVPVAMVQGVETANNVNILPPNFTVDKAQTVNNEKVIGYNKLDFSKITNDDLQKSIKTEIASQQHSIEKNFLGFRIADLHDFFMIFVVMAGIAAIILFFLSSTLLKMMGGIR
jgi:POT family proton-dependent oligopeptide transporter